MATSKTTNTYNRQCWETSEFPILCQTCLGENPYIRMTKEKYGKECKICSRPFTVFRWCPGLKMRFKKTEICQTCCRLKNVCQTCLLDLEYGLPTQICSSALKLQDDIPKNGINHEFYLQNIEGDEANSDITNPSGALKKLISKNDILTKLARTAPYYKRNLPHICSFWVKGECKRGEECPYRHEKPSDPDSPLSDQNIRDRYYGTNDPVADKMMLQAGAWHFLEPPDDKTITTLYVGNLGYAVSDLDLRDHFYQYGEIRSIIVADNYQCGFVQFTSRASAELAAERTFKKLIINGMLMNVKWGKSAAGRTGKCDFVKTPVTGLPLPVPLPEFKNYFNIDTNNQNAAALISSYPQMLPPPNPPEYYGLSGIQLPGSANLKDSCMPQVFYPSQSPGHFGTGY